MNAGIRKILTTLLLGVFLVSSTGFTLIHHFCETCGEYGVHFSFLSTTEVKCTDIPLLFKKEENECTSNSCSCGHEMEQDAKSNSCSTESDCCNNEGEYFKLISPYSVDDDSIDLIPTEVTLLTSDIIDPSHNKIHYTIELVRNNGPPDDISGRQISISNSTFLL